MPRPCHCRILSEAPRTRIFAPSPEISSGRKGQEAIIGFDSLEALRLADYMGMGMAEAALRMGISRHTFGRLLRKGRAVVARALCEGLVLKVEGGTCAPGGGMSGKGDENMSDSILVAVPSEAPGGLDAAPSAHFGHCAAYTIATVKEGAIGDIKIEPNRGHEHGGCVEPVKELAKQGVSALLAGGMGMKPLGAMMESGIRVYYAAGFATVRDALEAFAAGKLQAFGRDKLCKGCGGHH